MSNEITDGPDNPSARINSLAHILRMGGEKMTLRQTKLDIPAKQLLAEILWLGAVTGMLDFGNGDSVPLEPKDYLKLIEFIFSRTDGLPKPNVEVRATEVAQVNQNTISVTVFSDHIKPPEQPKIIDITENKFISDGSES